jgi:hypothetical protein
MHTEPMMREVEMPELLEVEGGWIFLAVLALGAVATAIAAHYNL